MHIGYAQDKTKIGIFIDGTKIEDDKMKVYLNKITGGTGSSKSLYYNRGGQSNIFSYRWDHNIGQSGQGSGVIVSNINGQTIFTRYSAETQKITTYILKPEEVRKRLAQSSNKIQTLKSKNFLGAQAFDDVKWAFDSIDMGKAPEGIGFTANVQMRGDPSIIPPLRILFKDYFPAPLKQDQITKSIIKFFVQKVTHKLEANTGYTCDLTIADTYAIDGTFLAPTVMR